MNTPSWMRVLASHNGCSVRQDYNGNVMFVSAAGIIVCNSAVEAAKMAPDVETKRILEDAVLAVPYVDGDTAWYGWYKNTGHIPRKAHIEDSEVAIDSIGTDKNGDSVESMAETTEVGEKS